jgi:ankyrin repeat protein
MMGRCNSEGLPKMRFLAGLVLISTVLLGCDKNTELMKEAQRGDVAAMKQLIASGADVNERNRYGWTALMHAARSGHADAARALLDAGSNVEIRDESGATPLIRAATKGHADVVALLLERGAAPNTVDSNGWSALMWAVNREHADVVRALIAGGADVNLRADGRTAMQVAKMQGSNEILQLLQNAGGKF